MGGQLRYLSGFGNQHATEAVPGALPVGRNSPQRAPFGLYAEQLSGTAFTAPRAHNQRTWMYRVRPTAAHPPFHPYHPAGHSGRLRTAPLAGGHDGVVPANRLRWDPHPLPGQPVDFVDSLFTMAANGAATTHAGVAIHTYAASASMHERVFVNADGELLLVPQLGALLVNTELGSLQVSPGSMALVPRGLRFRVDLDGGASRGYVCENYGAAFRLPELGPIGANGLANPRDFEYPTAGFADPDAPTTVIQKLGGQLWACELPHSPLDVVAWHGNLAPFRYDLSRFNTINTVSYDHPDPSIFTVLTSPSETPGTANADFVIFPPRWMVAEHTFRPPWFHRNVMSEFMGLVHGVYDAKAAGFVPGGASLHNAFSAHGPDVATYERASTVPLAPHKIEDTLAFMFETRWPLAVTAQAMEAAHRQSDYDAVWSGFAPARLPTPEG